jgi:hypothetical protein
VFDLHAAGAIGTFDSAVIRKEADGKVRVTKTEKPTQHGAWTGAAVGALVGIPRPGRRRPLADDRVRAQAEPERNERAAREQVGGQGDGGGPGLPRRSKRGPAALAQLRCQPA